VSSTIVNSYRCHNFQRRRRKTFAEDVTKANILTIVKNSLKILESDTFTSQQKQICKAGMDFFYRIYRNPLQISAIKAVKYQVGEKSTI
jgi:hypothetical protein